MAICQNETTPVVNGYRQKCGRCGRVTITSTERLFAPCRVRRLGDKIEDWLNARGVTKKRFTAWLVYLRLKPPGVPCGCTARREKLNRIGDGVLRWWRSLAVPPPSAHAAVKVDDNPNAANDHAEVKV